MQKSAARKKIERLEAEIAIKQGVINKWNDEHHEQLAHNSMLKNQCAALSHQVENLQRELEIRSSRLMVLQSDRDRLTAAIEVMARRHASPSAENDRTRAGWRHAQANSEEATRRERAADKGTDRS